jgi:phage/plasmid-associated DNA primase
LGIIVGKSLLTINDMKFDKHVNNGFIQLLLNLVGGDSISINPKHKPIFDYFPEANIVISSNEVPNFRGNLSGLESKFVFNVFQRDESKLVDLTLKQRMLDTMPYIIRKAIKMYPETVESGYDFDTERGKVIRDQFAESASVCIRYIDEYCILGEGFNDSSQEVYDEFRTYAKDQGEKNISSQTQFQTEIMTHFLGKIVKKRINSKVGKKVTALLGIRRNWRGNTIDDPKPVPLGLMAPQPASPTIPNDDDNHDFIDDAPVPF